MTGNDASDEPSGSVATDGDALNSPFDEFIRQSPDILWVHVDHDARVVDTNDAFRHELTVPDEGQSLFSILTPDAGEAVFLAHRLTGPGVPMVFHQVDGRPGYLFHVYWRSSARPKVLLPRSPIERRRWYCWTSTCPALRVWTY